MPYQIKERIAALRRVRLKRIYEELKESGEIMSLSYFYNVINGDVSNQDADRIAEKANVILTRIESEIKLRQF